MPPGGAATIRPQDPFGIFSTPRSIPLADEKAATHQEDPFGVFATPRSTPPVGKKVKTQLVGVPVCGCGNQYHDDAKFCRVCGDPRQMVEKALKIPTVDLHLDSVGPQACCVCVRAHEGGASPNEPSKAGGHCNLAKLFERSLSTWRRNLPRRRR